MSDNRKPRVRVGAVSYLNTKPLVYGLAERASQIDLTFDLPSRLADRLAAGTLDVGLIPTIEFFQNPRYFAVSDACIACRGPVLSVKLFSRVPMRQIRSLALDEGSRTSVALAKILLRARFGLTPECVNLPIGARAEDTSTDAVLLIGDRAIHAPPANFVDIWDLGDEWCRWSELPFVFALWVARPGQDVGRLEDDLQRARDHGLQNLEAIAQCEAESVGLSYQACLGYLRDNLYFYLGPRERRGLELFHSYASEYGLAPRSGSSLAFA